MKFLILLFFSFLVSGNEPAKTTIVAIGKTDIGKKYKFLLKNQINVFNPYTLYIGSSLITKKFCLLKKDNAKIEIDYKNRAIEYKYTIDIY